MNNSLKNQGLRRCKHSSSYFQGAYNKYGRYQWDIKYYGFENDFEPEIAVSWALGEHVKISNTSNKYHFEQLTELLGRKVEAYVTGRSGGWLVIDTELTDAELELVDAHVEACLKALPEFLKEEREYQLSQIVELGGKSEGE